MVGGVGREPHGARLSHVLIFVLAPGLDKNTWLPRSMGRGVWEGRWLGVVGIAGGGDLLAGWLADGWLMAGCWLGDGWLNMPPGAGSGLCGARGGFILVLSL